MNDIIPLTQFIETSQVTMDNYGFVGELKRKCSKSIKKNSEDLRFSNLSLMKKLSTDDSQLDLITKLNSAITEDDLEKIR